MNDDFNKNAQKSISPMSKEVLIEIIQDLPEDMMAFSTLVGDNDDFSVKIFTKPKEKEFLEWYFGP